MKKYLKLFIIFFMIIILKPDNIFALDYNVSSSITSPVAPSGSGTYTGEEQNGSTSSWNINTRYNGTLQRIRYNIPVPSSVGECFSTNMNYTITMNMATSDWRNRFGSVRVLPYSSSSTNWSNGHVTFVSMKKIYFTFKIPSSDTSCYQSVYVDLPSNATFTPFTGETNWNLSSIILSDELSTGGSSGGSSGGTSSSNQDIIDSSNQNTQNIIENQTNNTNNIIDNSNQNTQNIINNQNENTNQITNAIDNVNNQLGSCIKNILTSFYNISPYYNMYLGDDKIAYQIQPDNYTTSRTVKVMLFGRSGRIEDLPYQSLRTGRFNFSFTYNTNITSLVFGINGQNIDTLLKLNLEPFNLDDGSTYTLSFTIINASDGSSSFNNFSLVKGEYISNVSIPYGEGICTSKLDSFISTANQNTTDIINNQNQNTQDTIESQKVCKWNLKEYNKSIVNNNTLFFNNASSNTDMVFEKGKYKVEFDYTKQNNGNLYLRVSSSSTNLNVGHLSPYITEQNENFNLWFWTNQTISSSFVDTIKIYKWECIDGNQAINDTINSTNSYLTDDSNPNIADSEFTNLFNSVGFNDPLSYLLQLPVQFINQLVSQSNSCQTISLGTLWGVSLSLPCIDIGSIIGQQVWDIIDVLFSVGLLVVIFKNLYQTFANLMTMGGEKEAREKFSMPTPMEFLSIVLGGDR